MTQTDAKRKRILVVEDEPIISRVCVKTLRADGFEVDIAMNGLLAKDMASKKVHDLCLVDIRTPEMDGMEFYQYLEEEHPELTDRVIFTTGDVLSSDVKTFLGETDRPLLAKPFTPNELRAVIREAYK